MGNKEPIEEALKKYFDSYNNLAFLMSQADQFGKTPQDYSDKMLMVEIAQEENYVYFDQDDEYPSSCDGEVLVDLVSFMRLSGGVWKARTLSDQQTVKLLDEAKGDYIKWKICKWLIDMESASYELRFKLLYNLPKKPRKFLNKFWLRNPALIGAVRIAKSFGLAHYHNNDESSQKTACDKISEVLNEIYDIKISASQIQLVTKKVSTQ
jgi:hypothetical protein